MLIENWSYGRPLHFLLKNAKIYYDTPIFPKSARYFNMNIIYMPIRHLIFDHLKQYIIYFFAIDLCCLDFHPPAPPPLRFVLLA